MSEANPMLLDRGGLTTVDIDLADAQLANGKDLVGVRGHALRLLRHGSNPGARFNLSFGGKPASTFFAPGQRVSGGFSNATLKLAPGSAKVGKATLAVLREAQVDLTEDLIISAIGPVDLLGKTSAEGDAVQWVTVPEDTLPNAAYAAQTGAFDGSGWELLRVMVKGVGLTTAAIHFFHNPSWLGTNWQHCTVDGVVALDDSPGAGGFAQRTFLVPWGGRGVGCVAVYSLLPGGLTGLDVIIQGVR